MFIFSKKFIFLRYIIIWILLISFIECIKKKSDPITKFIFSNEKICGDLFDNPGWLPAQSNCRIRCNNLKEICMGGIDANDKMFTCRSLPSICSEQLKSYLMINGYSLEEFQVNEPQGPPLTKKFNDNQFSIYKSPPSLEPLPPSMAPNDQDYVKKNVLSRNDEDFMIDSPPSIKPYIDQAKKYEEDVTLQVEEPFIAQSSVYDNQFIKSTTPSNYHPEVPTTTTNYVTTGTPIQISNEIIDNYGLPYPPPLSTINVQPQMPSINVEPQMPSLNVEPQMPSLNVEPQMPSMNVEPQMPSMNVQPQVPSINVEPQVPLINVQPEIPLINVEPTIPSLNIQPQMPSINIEPQMPTINVQPQINLQPQLPSLKVVPSSIYIPSSLNYNQKPEPTAFNIPTPIFTYNLHNQDNQPPGYGPTKYSSQYSKITNYKTKNRLQHVPTSQSKYGYYYDGYNYRKNTWKQVNQKINKKILYSDSGFFNGLRDKSKKCCTWALNGMCDGYWQRIRLICPKSCGTVICTTGNGKTGCNRAIDVNVYDCERQNNYHLGLQQNALNGGLSRPYYNQLNNYQSNSLGYQNNDYVNNNNNNNNHYLGNEYSIENEIVGWKKMFRARRA